jgi:hypothetical protein
MGEFMNPSARTLALTLVKQFGILEFSLGKKLRFV